MIIIPADKNKANEYIYRFAKHFQQSMKTAQFSPGKHRSNSFMQSLKFTPPPLERKPQVNHHSHKKTPNIK